MKYHIIATINDKKFLSEIVEADNADQAESFALDYISKVYVGEISVIRVVKESEWQKLIAETRKKQKH